MSNRSAIQPATKAPVLLALLLGFAGAPVLAQDYQVFGDIEGTTTYQYLEDAETEHRLTGRARLRADHRLTFERADFVADTELLLRSPGEPDPAVSLLSISEQDGGPGRTTESQDAEVDYFVDEAYLSLFPLSPISVTAGKQRVNWGTGYTFSPTDTLHPRSASGRDVGYRGLSLTYTPTADYSVSAHLSADDALDDTEESAHTGLRYALYGSAFFGNAEVVLSGVYGPEATLRPGLAASADVAGFVLAAEAALELENRVAYPEGATAADAGFAVPDDPDPAPLGLFAIEYNTASDILDVAAATEYLYAGSGYDRGEAKDLFAALDAAAGETEDPVARARAEGFSDIDKGQVPLYLGKHYLASSLSLGIAGYVELGTGVLANAADWSYEAEHTVRVTALEGVDFSAIARWYAGGEDTEFGSYPDGLTTPGRLQIELGSTVHF